MVKPDINAVKLKTLEGKTFNIQKDKQRKATVIFFVSPECPLCQSYSVNIKNMADNFRKKGFDFLAIVPGKNFTSVEVQSFKTKFKLQNISFYFDPSFELAHLLHATVTPEVFVIAQNGNLVYGGRIDNWLYELGKKRRVITEHNLENILIAIDHNTSLTFKKTKAYGCFIQ